MDSVKKTRPIRSNLRKRQAEMTANLIVEAAKALFLERGYTATTIEAIAERAGVAVSTVYAVYGSKRSILRAMRAPWHEHSHIRTVVYGEAEAAVPPAERLEALAGATRRQWESGAQLTAIYSSAAAADPEAAAELAEALAGRRRGMEHFAGSLEPHLRPGLGTRRAAALLQALCLLEVYQELVRQSGWSGDEYETWLAEALKRELLGA